MLEEYMSRCLGLVVFCLGFIAINFNHIIQFASLALRQSHNFPNDNEATLMNTGNLIKQIL